MKPVTLITGTRKGIGRYLVDHYLNQGHIVYGCSRGKPDWTAENYFHSEADVTDEKRVKKIFSEIRTAQGRLDNLINNAGIASMNHVMLTPVSTVHEILGTNVIGTFLFAREAAKLMSLNNFGRIVNFTTIATPLKLEGEAIYAASKAAVFSLTEVLAREVAGYNITVNAIGPTPIETDLIRAVPQEKMNRLISRQAISRMGKFEDVSNVTDFFLRKESDFVTGQNIYLGGI